MIEIKNSLTSKDFEKIKLMMAKQQSKFQILEKLQNSKAFREIRIFDDETKTGYILRPKANKKLK